MDCFVWYPRLRGALSQGLDFSVAAGGIRRHTAGRRDKIDRTMAAEYTSYDRQQVDIAPASSCIIAQ